MSTYSVATKFKALDKMTPVFNTITKSASRMQNRVSSNIATLGAGYSKLKQTVFSLRNAFRMLIVTMGTRRIIDYINNIAEAGDKLAKTAISIGMTAQSLKVMADDLEHCCKRSVRLSIIEALKFLNEHFNINLEYKPKDCQFSGINDKCVKDECPIFSC